MKRISAFLAVIIMAGAFATPLRGICRPGQGVDRRVDSVASAAVADNADGGEEADSSGQADESGSAVAASRGAESSGRNGRGGPGGADGGARERGSAEGRTITSDPRYALYIPPGIKAGERRPLVVALNPDGDGRGIVRFWQYYADRYRLVVVGSNRFRNNVPTGEIFDELMGAVKTLDAKYPVDRSRVIVAGNSGGGMGAHMISYYYPDLVWGVITDCGRIHPNYLQPKRFARYPRGKRALFLTGTSDYNRSYLRSECEALRTRGWATKLIEYPGGHCQSTRDSYVAGLDWLLGGR